MCVSLQFEQENQRLIGEMNSLFDEVRQIEGKVVEITRLQEIFTEKVLQQEAEIDNIHQLVVGATENIKEGNEDIREVGTLGPENDLEALSPGWWSPRQGRTHTAGRRTMHWMDRFHSSILPSPGPTHCPAEERSGVQGPLPKSRLGATGEACWTRALVFDGTTRVDSVEWTLFSGCSPQVWVDVGPLLGHHLHRTARKHRPG